MLSVAVRYSEMLPVSFTRSCFSSRKHLLTKTAKCEEVKLINLRANKTQGMDTFSPIVLGFFCKERLP
jgi:hypothetical protein